MRGLGEVRPIEAADHTARNGPMRKGEPGGGSGHLKVLDLRRHGCVVPNVALVTPGAGAVLIQEKGFGERWPAVRVGPQQPCSSCPAHQAQHSGELADSGPQHEVKAPAGLGGPRPSGGSRRGPDRTPSQGSGARVPLKVLS